MHNIFLDPRFWLAVSFFIFLALMIKYALPAILKMLDGKANMVAEEVLKASEAKAKAEQLLADAEINFQNAITFSKKLIADAEKEARNLIEHSQKITEEEIQRKLNLVTNRIHQEEEKAIREVKGWLISAAVGVMKENIAKNNDKKSPSISIANSINDVSKLIN